MNYIKKTDFTSTLLNNKEYFLYALVYIMYLILMPRVGHGYDTWCWEQWTCYIHSNTLGNVYYSSSDYPPVYYYILEAFGNLKGSEEMIRAYIFQLKYITLFFEFCSMFLLFGYIKKELRPWFFLAIILNPGFFYNNIIWGQVDGIFCFLILSCIVLILNKHNTLGMLTFILCVNFKVQAIFYLPLIIILLIYNISDYKGLRYSIYVCLALFSLELLILLPFINSDTTNMVWDAFVYSIDKYPVVSMNAYNLWFWFLDGNLIQIEDKNTWLFLSYKQWGLLAFFLTSAVALMPAFITAVSHAITKATNKSEKIGEVFLTGALITLLFFFCNTQMHERYSHNAMIFLAAYFAVTGNILPFMIMTFCYFLNMEAVMQVLKFPNYSVVLFKPEYIAGFYLVLIVYLFYLLYKQSTIAENIKQSLRTLFAGFITQKI